MPLQGQFWTPRRCHAAWGRRRRVLIANPEAGHDWTFNPTPGYLTIVELATALLTAAAKAATREVKVKLTDGNNTLYEQYTGASATESKAVRLNLGLSTDVAVGQAGDATASAPLPSLLLEPGWTLSVVTTAIDAADQWSAIVLSVEEYEMDPQHDLQEIHALHERVERIERQEARHGSPQAY